jgi:hypothetical protein
MASAALTETSKTRAPMGPPAGSYVWPWILVSTIVHLVIFLLSWGLIGSGLFVPGHGVADGSGYGGTSVDLEIAGPASNLPMGALPPSAAADEPAPATPPPVPTEPVEEPVDAPTETVDDGALAIAPTPPLRRPTPPRPSDPRDQEGQPAETVAPNQGRAEVDDVGGSDQTDPSAPGERQAAGTGGDDSTAGAQAGDPTALILGSAGLGGSAVSARQALLPNSGVCTDPVVGTWLAQKYRASDHTWVRFTLHVRREGSSLSGTIVSRIWTGRPSDPRPGECTAFGMDHTWQMSAHGRVDGDDMTFVSTHARLVRQDCPRSDHSYAPDRFSGRVHALREVFDAVNNDGAFDIDEPYVFRRTSCE